MNIVVLISGEGSNLQAIIDAITVSALPITIQAVISNKAKANGLARAKCHQIPTHILASKNYASKIDYDTALQVLLEDYNPELIVLAGFMRVLTKEFVKAYRGRIINIHPSLLPKYRGLNTHQRVLENHEIFHGTSIHFVTEKLDGGPVIAQEKIKIEKGDTVESLQKRILTIEHQLYPKVIQLFANHRLSLCETAHVLLDGYILEKPLCLSELNTE